MIAASNREKLDYLLSSLDMHLSAGKSPAEAWVTAVENYAFVYHTEDGRLPIGRAAELALKHLRENDDSDSNET